MIVLVIGSIGDSGGPGVIIAAGIDVIIIISMSVSRSNILAWASWSGGRRSIIIPGDISVIIAREEIVKIARITTINGKLVFASYTTSGSVERVCSVYITEIAGFWISKTVEYSTISLR